MPIRQPWDSCGLGWYSPSEPGSAVRNPDSSTGSGNEPCRCANPTAINGMRGFFPTSAACVKCPPHKTGRHRWICGSEKSDWRANRRPSVGHKRSSPRQIGRFTNSRAEPAAVSRNFSLQPGGHAESFRKAITKRAARSNPGERLLTVDQGGNTV